MTSFVRHAVCLTLSVVSIAFSFEPVLAAPGDPPAGGSLQGSLQKGLGDAAPAELKGVTNPATIFGNVVSGLISILGVLLFAYLLYGGFKYMTAQGEKTNVSAAIGIIRDAIIGLVIIAASYAIANFVIEKISGATSQVQQGGQVPK